MNDIPQPLEVGLGLALTVFIIQKVVDILPQMLILLKGGKVNGIYDAGSKPVEFWQAEMRRAASEAITPVLQSLVNAEKEQTEAINELTFQLREYIAHEKGRADGRSDRRGR